MNETTTCRATHKPGLAGKSRKTITTAVKAGTGSGAMRTRACTHEVCNSPAEAPAAGSRRVVDKLNLASAPPVSSHRSLSLLATAWAATSVSSHCVRLLYPCPRCLCTNASFPHTVSPHQSISRATGADLLLTARAGTSIYLHRLHTKDVVGHVVSAPRPFADRPRKLAPCRVFSDRNSGQVGPHCFRAIARADWQTLPAILRVNIFVI